MDKKTTFRRQREVIDLLLKGGHITDGVSIENLPQVSSADRLADARQCVSDIALALPSLKNAAESVLSRLRETLPNDARGPQRRTIHNDFHWKQICGKENRLTLLDFERCAIGDPMVDVAGFAAQMSILPVRDDVSVSSSEASTWRQAFLSAWESTTRTAVDMGRLRWNSAVALLVLARGMTRHLRRGWVETVRGCVRHAAEAAASRDDIEVPA